MRAKLKLICPSAYINIFTGKVKINKKKNTTGHENGAKLVSSLVDTSHKIQIRKIPRKEKSYGNSCAASDDGCRTSSGSGSIIKFDPNANLFLLTLVDDKVQVEGRNPAIGLAHELIHALHNAEGENKANLDIYSYKNLAGYNVDYRTNEEELRTIGIPDYCNTNDITENKIRAELNHNPRVEY